MRRPEWLRWMLLHPALPTGTDFLGVGIAATTESLRALPMLLQHPHVSSSHTLL